jgi:hypothetical protein
MKNIRAHSVNIPWYLRPLAVMNYERMDVTIGVWPAIKFWSKKVWFLPPNWLMDYELKNCVNYMPDFVDPKDGRLASGNKVRPFLGYVLRPKAGMVIGYKWWREIEKFNNKKS